MMRFLMFVDEIWTIQRKQEPDLKMRFSNQEQNPIPKLRFFNETEKSI